VPHTGTGGRHTPPPSIEEISSHFPELEILELLGTGGMGAVYKARQPQLDRTVALKILARELTQEPAFVERFNREAKILARLSHPNIVAVFDFGTAGPFCFLLMEYVDGVNLRQAMRTGGFTPSETLALVGDMCSALQFAHEEGILHRDIKPENVLIDLKGRVKIADFGIAKLLGPSAPQDVTLTLHGSILGSPHYMAPEQIKTPGDVDQRADIYSLGVVFYEMLTGELPLGRFALPSEKAAMDVRIDEIVLRTLAQERKARFQTAGEVRTEVEAYTKEVNTSGNLNMGRNSNTGKKIALTGAWLQLGSVVLLIASVSAMIQTFNVTSMLDANDPAKLAEALSQAVLPASIGLIFGLIGTVFLLVALFAKEYRAKWFYRFMMIYSLLSLSAFPVGTAIGIICLVYITRRKDEFKQIEPN
jgi:serine/threonine protein kinase